MHGFGRKGHTRKHDIGSSVDHKGNIFDALKGAVHALTAANVAVDTQTLNDAIAAAIVGMQWQPPIIRFEAMVTNEPVAPSDGDRYISTEAGTIPSTTQAVLIGDVCEWDTPTGLWIVTTPNDGWAVIEQGVDPNIAWWFNGTIWRKLGTIVDHSNLLNLNWSVAMHIIDTSVNFNGHTIYHDDGDMLLASGCHYTAPNWIADNATASILYLSITGAMQLFYDTGLTPTNSFVPTKTFEIDNTGKISTVNGISSNNKISILGSTEQGAAGEEMDVVEYSGDVAADHILTALKGIIPTTQDYMEVFGGEDGSGQFGKGFIVRHNKATAKYSIYYSTSGKFDGTETLLFEIDSSGNASLSGKLNYFHSTIVACAGYIPVGSEFSTWSTNDYGICTCPSKTGTGETELNYFFVKKYFDGVEKITWRMIDTIPIERQELHVSQNGFSEIGGGNGTTEKPFDSIPTAISYATGKGWDTLTIRIDADGFYNYGDFTVPEGLFLTIIGDTRQTTSVGEVTMGNTTNFGSSVVFVNCYISKLVGNTYSAYVDLVDSWINDTATVTQLELWTSGSFFEFDPTTVFASTMIGMWYDSNHLRGEVAGDWLASNLFVPTGNKIGLKGWSGNSHILYNDTDDTIDIVVDGNKVCSITASIGLTTNLTWSGKAITGTAGENLAIGDQCYYKQTDQKWWKADARTEALMDGDIAMATETILADAVGMFLTSGYIRNDSWAWTVDGSLRKVYINPTPGQPTQTMPTTGEFVRITGYPLTATVIHFNPTSSYAEV